MLGHTTHKYYSGIGGEIEASPIIKNGVIIGREAVVVGDITVGGFSYVATNSVLLESTNDYALMAGIPAKLIRYRNQSEIKKLYNKMEEDYHGSTK